ncbi:MAG: FtsX-like permease family protein, partial [Clostridia bacterium]|nr:FtsX-like permease family protein [Clostridia bacterium]
LIYNARQTAYEKFIAENPEPMRPDDATKEEMDAYNEAWQQWNNERWSVQSEAQYAVDPLHKLYNISSLNLSRQEILDLFEEARGYFPDCQVDIGIKNIYNEFENVTLAGMFFENINDRCAYLSDDLYTKYYISENYDSYRSEFVTNYVAPEDAFISSVYVPFTHDNASVQELVNMTYARGEDDSTVIIMNTQMQQLEMFIDMADTLGTAFLISGLVLALFAFLLMFNFISASISAKRKEIGILRAIGARTRDVYKIFMSESMIIALICFLVSVLGTFGLCVLLNSILTAETIIVISIFSFGPLSALCIFGIALLTAIVSTVIPVAMYSRKPPIESIRTL